MNPVSLRLGKVYPVVKPLPGDLGADLRLIDEDGEDYLYPSRHFDLLSFPPKARRAVQRAARPA